MSTIPDVRDMPTRTVDTTKDVYTPDTGYAGRKVGALGKLAQAQYETQTKSELAKAKVDYQVMKAQQDVAYDDDDDEGTIVDRYEVGMKEGLSKAASGITDSTLRSMFIQDSQVGIEEGKLRMGQLAHKKRGDKQIAYLTNATQTIHKGAIEGGDIGDAHTAIEGMWRSLAEQGHISQQDAETKIRTSKYDIALGKLKSMDPEGQIEALTSTWAEELPLDVRTRLKEEALDELLNDKALMTAHDWMQEDISIDEANQRLGQITDSDEYEKTRNRFLQMKNDDELGLQELQKSLYTDHFADVFFGNKKVSDIPELESYQMTPGQLNNLQQAEIRATKIAAGDYVPTYSDPEVKDTLRGLVANDQFQKAKTYFSENYSKLNDSDYRYFETQVDGEKSKEPFNRGLLTANQQMQKLLKDSKLHKDPAAEKLIWDNVTEKYNQYIEDNQKRPPGVDVNNWIADEFIRIRRDPTALFFTDDVYVHDMSPNERDDFFKAADYLRHTYPGISRDKVIEQYEKMLRANLVSEGMN